MPDNPNVIFILSDQHNAKVLGHKDHPDVQTPNLDRLAAEGVRCENAITQNPICTPSRVSWLSGQYCHNHGYYGLSGPNPGGLPNILGHFRRYGYTTAAIGKIHCPEYWVEDESDRFREVCPGCSINGAPEYMEFLEKHGGMENYLQSEKRKRPNSRAQTLDGFPSLQPYRESPEGYIVTESISFMEQALAEGKPFFLHASTPKPHQVYCPAREFWDMYDEESIQLPPNADYEMKDQAPHLRRTAENFRNGDWIEFEPKTYEAARRRKLHGYLGSVSHMDHAVGELLDWLDNTGLAENTIVIYSSDHGDYACEHGIIEKAPGICHDAITRIPFLWRWPGNLKSGHVIQELTETVDMTATVCGLAGIAPMGSSEGKDIRHLLEGGFGEVRDAAVTEFAWSKSLRKGDWRLVYYPPELFRKEYPDGFGELYNLKNDPWEMENLYFSDEHQDRVRDLQAELLRWIITHTRPKTILPHVKNGNPAQGTVRYNNYTQLDGKLPADAVNPAGHRDYL